MTKTGITIIIIISFSLNTYGQGDQTLSEKLWTQVQSCYSMFEDMDEDGQVDYDEIIDDSQNGYLKVTGSFPTCGCVCENIVGAYKTNAGQYVFVKKSAWPCSWEKAISSSHSLDKIFPFDFEVDGFFSKSLGNIKQNATFYIDVEIPRKGTDTKVTIKLIPFALNVRSSENIVFSHSEENVSNYYNLYSKVRTIAKRMQNERTLEYLLNNQFEKISSIDKELVNEAIGGGAKNKEELVNVLQDLKQTYDLYNQIKHQWLILGWNRAEETFYIKEKGESPKRVSLREFLIVGQFWGAIC